MGAHSGSWPLYALAPFKIARLASVGSTSVLWFIKYTEWRDTRHKASLLTQRFAPKQSVDTP